MTKKSVLLFASALALAAFAMPSMASAASWAVVGSTHDFDQLPANPVRFLSTDGTIGSSCAGTSMHLNVAGVAVLTVLSATFTGCMGTGLDGTPCTTTPAGKFPWQATGLSTTNVQIHNVEVTILFENTPGSPTACPANGLFMTMTGTLASANHTHWDATTHTLTFVNATGLLGHVLGMPLPMRVDGSLTDRQHTLTLS